MSKQKTPLTLAEVRAELIGKIHDVSKDVNNLAKNQTKIVKQIEAVRTELKGEMTEMKKILEFNNLALRVFIEHSGLKDAVVNAMAQEMKQKQSEEK